MKYSGRRNACITVPLLKNISTFRLMFLDGKKPLKEKKEKRKIIVY